MNFISKPITVNVHLDKKNRFDRTMIPYFDAVFNFAMQLTNRDEARAEDLVQDTFLRAYSRFDQFETGSNAKSWLFTICNRIFINDYRKAKVRPKTSELEEGRTLGEEGEAIDSFDQYGSVFPELVGKFGDEVQAALDALKPETRTIILLWVDKFPYEEIAEILEIPVGTVRSRINRARKTLMDLLGTYALDNGINSTPKID